MKKIFGIFFFLASSLIFPVYGASYDSDGEEEGRVEVTGTVVKFHLPPRKRPRKDTEEIKRHAEAQTKIHDTLKSQMKMIHLLAKNCHVTVTALEALCKEHLKHPSNPKPQKAWRDRKEVLRDQFEVLDSYWELAMQTLSDLDSESDKQHLVTSLHEVKRTVAPLRGYIKKVCVPDFEGPSGPKRNKNKKGQQLRFAEDPVTAHYPFPSLEEARAESHSTERILAEEEAKKTLPRSKEE